MAASNARFSSVIQDESSIEQQQRKCRDRAVQDGVPIASEFEFADFAISGTKRERVGLNAMLAAAEEGKFQVIYFESLSRLARESVISMPLLKQLVYVWRIRIVSVSEGIDSAQPNWELIAQFLSWTHQQFIKTLRDAVLRGHQHSVINDWSAGDWCFGYSSEPILGSENGRKGKNAKPCKRIVINAEQAAWVRRIFEWIVIDGWSMRRIAKELTRRNVPKDHRATKPGWHPDYVQRILKNEKYIGLWRWGRKTNTRDPFTGRIIQEDRPVDEIAQWTRERPELRLIEDHLFFGAQAKLDELRIQHADQRDEKGQLKGSKRGTKIPSHLLQGVLKCGSCGHTFQVSGDYGRRMGCSGYKSGLCQCYTGILRELTERKILEVLSEKILRDPKWLDAVVAETQRAFREQEFASPSAIADLEKQIKEDEHAISRLIQAIELGSDDLGALADRVRDRTQAKKLRQHELEKLRTANSTASGPPTREGIIHKLQHLDKVLNTGGYDANKALRDLIGGHIVLHLRDEPGKKRRFYVGAFSLRTRILQLGTSSGPASNPNEQQDVAETIEIEFRDDPPWAVYSQEAKDRVDAGQYYPQIAAELGITEQWAAKAFAHWHRVREMAVPDLRHRGTKRKSPRLAESMGDLVQALWDKGLLIQDIAHELGISWNVVHESIKLACAQRGEVIPDGRHRRNTLERQSIGDVQSHSQPADQKATESE